jgi:hypothetical protein
MAEICEQVASIITSHTPLPAGGICLRRTRQTYQSKLVLLALGPWKSHPAAPLGTDPTQKFSFFFVSSYRGLNKCMKVEIND